MPHGPYIIILCTTNCHMCSRVLMRGQRGESVELCSFPSMYCHFFLSLYAMRVTAVHGRHTAFEPLCLQTRANKENELF